MKIKTISQISFCIILFLGCSSFAAASSKCYYTFSSKGWKTAFHVLLNNPTTEILEKQYFPNFETYVPFVFDENGKIYQYREAKRHWLDALIPVQIGKNDGQRIWVIPDGRIEGIKPDNTYYFFMIGKIVTETDYIVSNIFKFHLDNEYQLSNTETLLWSDLPEITHVPVKAYLKSYLPRMKINASVDYIISEINMDKRNYQLPVYDSSIINAAKMAYNSEIEKREKANHNMETHSETTAESKVSSEDFNRAHKKFLEDMLKEAGLWYKYKDKLQKQK